MTGAELRERMALYIRLIDGSEKIEGGCRLWRGPFMSRGYGEMHYGDNKQDLTHRLMYYAVHGPIPEGCYVCHHCDTPACIEPMHLYAGTPKQNSRDMHVRGRGRGKLTVDKILAMRAEFAEGQLTISKLGRKFGVSRTTAHFIVNGGRYDYIVNENARSCHSSEP